MIATLNSQSQAYEVDLYAPDVPRIRFKPEFEINDAVRMYERCATLLHQGVTQIVLDASQSGTSFWRAMAALNVEDSKLQQFHQVAIVVQNHNQTLWANFVFNGLQGARIFYGYSRIFDWLTGKMAKTLYH